MAVPRASISDLPSAGRGEAHLPSSKPLVVHRLAEAWWAQHQAEGNMHRSTAIADRTFRASSVSMRCDRQLWYAMTQTPESNPTTISGAWRMGLGSLIHDALQNQLDDLGEGWRWEVAVDLLPIGIDGSAHADLVKFVCRTCQSSIRLVEILETKSDGWEEWLMCCSNDEHTDRESFCIQKSAAGSLSWNPEFEQADIVCELKTQGGFGFKMSATNFKGPAEGPKFDHILQGGLAARGLGATKVIVAYLSMENVSPDLAKAYSVSEIGQFAAEWKFLIDQLDPMLDAEVERINRLLRAVAANARPARMLHTPQAEPGAVVINPSTGAWVTHGSNGTINQTGKIWVCGYCRHQDLCSSDGPDAVSVTVDI